MISKNITIINKLGLHARASAKLVASASAFSSQVKIGTPDNMVDAKSIMSVMMLAASQGTELTLSAEGKDESAAIESVSDLINRYFDEPQDW